MCPRAPCQPKGQHPAHTGSHRVQLVLLCLSQSLHSFPLKRLPDPPITFDWTQFRFGVWGQRAPGGFRAKLQRWAGGSLCPTHFTHCPKSPHTAVHPLLKGLTHKLGIVVGLLHGRVLRRKLQHGAQLLEILLQVHVSWRTSMQPAVLT